MPTVFRSGGFRFFFYSNEGDPREPIHIHIESSDGDAKIWLQPEIKIADSYGYNDKTLRILITLVRENTDLIEGTWNEHFAR